MARNQSDDLSNAVTGMRLTSAQDNTAPRDNDEYVGTKYSKFMKSLSSNDVIGGLRDIQGTIREITQQMNKEQQAHRDKLAIIRQERADYDKFVKRYEDSLKIAQKEYDVKKLTAGITQQQLDVAEQLVEENESLLNSAKELSGEYSKQLSLENRRKQISEQYGRAAGHAARNLRDELQVQKELMNQMFGSSLANNGFNVVKTLQNVGGNKASLAMGSMLGIGPAAGSGMGMGALAGGAAMLGAGLVLGKIVDKIGENIERSIKLGIEEADISKTGASRGQGSASFRYELHSAMQGYGVTPEEEVQLAQRLRPMIGRQGSMGGFGNAMQTSAILGRAYGTDLQTTAQFVGGAVRYGGVGTDKGSQNGFAMAVAEAIGSGRLVGLQEELLQGVNQLVDITKGNVTGSVNPGDMLKMISGVSSLGLPNLRGSQAAQSLANISQGLSSPGGNFGWLVSLQSLKKTIDESPTRDYENGKLRSTSDYAYLMEQQSTGMFGLNVGGKARGTDWLKNALKMAMTYTGGNLGMAELAMGDLGMPPKIARGYLQYQDQIFSKGGVLDQYGLGNAGSSVFMNSANEKFITELAQAQSEGLDKEHQVATAFDAVAKDLHGKDLDNYVAAFNDSKLKPGSSPQAVVSALLQAGQNIQAVTPEDDIRNAVVNIDRYVMRLTDKGTELLAGILGYLSGSKSGSARAMAQANLESDRFTKELANAQAKSSLPGMLQTGQQSSDLENSDPLLLGSIGMLEHGNANWDKTKGIVEPQNGFINAGLFNLTSHGKNGGPLAEFLNQQYSDLSKEQLASFGNNPDLYAKDTDLMHRLYAVGDVTKNIGDFSDPHSARYQALHNFMYDRLPQQEAYWKQNYMDPTTNFTKKYGYASNSNMNYGLSMMRSVHGNDPGFWNGVGDILAGPGSEDDKMGAVNALFYKRLKSFGDEKEAVRVANVISNMRMSKSMDKDQFASSRSDASADKIAEAIRKLPLNLNLDIDSTSTHNVNAGTVASANNHNVRFAASGGSSVRKNIVDTNNGSHGAGGSW